MSNTATRVWDNGKEVIDMADYRDKAREIMSRIKNRKVTYVPKPPSPEGLRQLNAAFRAELYPEPTPHTEVELRTLAYRVLAEENDRKHVAHRDEHGEADLRRCHPSVARVCRRFARGLAVQLQPNTVRVPWTSHEDMLQQLDAACPDWRQRVQDRRPLVDP